MDNNKKAATQLTTNAAAQLQEGISLVLSRWTALQMAVENEWGGTDSRQKSRQFVLDVLSAFTQSKEKVYIDDLEDMLYDFMFSLNTQVEDGSVEEIAEKLMFMHEECLEGNFNSIEVLKETNGQRSAATYVRQDDASDGDYSSDGNENLDENASDMAIDATEPQSSLEQDSIVDDQPAEVEGDGWTIVTSRRNRGGRN